jgi:hypothetical protein
LLEGVPETGTYWIHAVGVTIRTPAGEPIPVHANILQLTGSQHWWLLLYPSPAIHRRVDGSKVGVSGNAVFSFLERGETSRLAPLETGWVPVAGRCNSMLQEGRSYESLLKVMCESPGEPPVRTFVTVVSEDGRQWESRFLGYSSPYLQVARQAWLSPLDRRQTFFNIVDQDSTAPPSRYLVPRGVLPNAKIGIKPQRATGYAVAGFEFRDIVLSDYVFRPPAK